MQRRLARHGRGNLLREAETRPLFFYGTEANKPTPIREKRALGADIWALFLMSGVERGRVSEWFENWQAQHPP